MAPKKSKNKLHLTLVLILLSISIFQFYQFYINTQSNIENQIQPDSLKFFISGIIAEKRENIYNRNNVKEILDSMTLSEEKASSYFNSPFLAFIISRLNLENIYKFQIYLLRIKILLLFIFSFLLPFLLIYKTGYLNYKPKISHYFLFVSLTLLTITHMRPYFDELISGQLSMFELFIFIMAMLLLPKRQLSSGLLLALGTVLKLGSIIMGIYLLIYKMKKGLTMLVVSTSSIIIFSIAYFGFPIYLEYVEKVILPFVTGIHVPALAIPDSLGLNQSINGLLSQIFLNEYIGKFIHTKPVFDSPIVFQIVSLVLTNFLIIFTSWVIYKSRPFVEKRKYLVILSYSLFIALIPLISPVTFSNGMVILLIPFSILLNEVIRKKDYISGIILLIFIFLNYIEPIKYHDNLLKYASIGYFKLLANLLLYRGNLRLLKNYSNHGV